MAKFANYDLLDKTMQTDLEDQLEYVLKFLQLGSACFMKNYHFEPLSIYKYYYSNYVRII